MVRQHPATGLPKPYELLMHSGDITAINQLEIGDELMGADSKPILLTDIRTAKEDCFEIRPIKGPSFLLGANDYLHLVRVGSSDAKQQTKTLPMWEYQQQSAHFKGVHLLYRSQVDFKGIGELPLDPYFLGLMLGDGCFKNATPSITTPDPEIVSYCFDMAEQMNMKVRINQIPGNQANSYYFSTAAGCNNPLTDILRDLDLFDKLSSEKFIPKIYKIADRESRTKLLAGLLDTDGYMLHKTFEYSTASKQLALDIAFISQSLGLMALPKEKVVDGQTYYRFCIYGDFSDIPIRVGRKIPGPRVQKRHVLRTGFTVHPVGKANIKKLYFDSTTPRFLKGDFMVMEGLTR